jgi:hypothetical protein
MRSMQCNVEVGYQLIASRQTNKERLFWQVRHCTVTLPLGQTAQKARVPKMLLLLRESVATLTWRFSFHCRIILYCTLT